MIDSSKYFVFIVSGGRTGTKYFGDSLSRLVADAYSVHEPDVWAGMNYHPLQRLRQFGFYHLFLGKLLRKTGIRNLSQQYVAGRISLEELAEKIHRHRDRYYDSLGADYIIESYTGWYGVLPGVQKVYPNYRIVAVIRDARDWVTSIMNWGTMYGPRDWVTRLGLGRLDPGMTGDADMMRRWPDMTQFEKVCWAWTAINSTILKDIEGDTNARVFRFEDIFYARNRRDVFTDLLEFITHFNDKSFSYTVDEQILSTRIHESVDKSFPRWPQWDEARAQTLERHCGELMRRFSYGEEPEWRRLTA